MAPAASAPNLAGPAARGKILRPETGKAAVASSRVGAYRLRARIRWLAPSARERNCGLLPVAHALDHPEIVVRTDADTGERRAGWAGILTCGHVWTCPVCSGNLRAERAERIALAVEHMGGRWQMLTLTIAHHRGMALKDTIAGIMRAIRRMKQGGAVQRMWADKVTASVRTLETLHGEENGWHPHVHMLLRTSEWGWDERIVLLRRWQECVARELGDKARPSDTQGLTWSEPFDGALAANRSLYVTKLGLELAGIGKTGKRGNLTTWGIAELAGARDPRAMLLWKEFHAATRGRRMIEMDDRMAQVAKDAKAAKVLAKLLEGDAAGAPLEIPEDLTTRRIRVPRDDLRALRMMENSGRHWIFPAVLSAAEAQGELGVRRWVLWAREQAVRPPRLVNPGGEAEGGAGGPPVAYPP